MKNKLSSLFFVATLISISIYYITESFSFMMPYGYDEIIFSWPMGRAISESFLLENINLLFAGFLSEDHIAPVSYLFSSFIYSESLDLAFSALPNK